MNGLNLSGYAETFFAESLTASLLKICILIAVAYLLSRDALFGRLLLNRASTRDKMKVFVFFAALVLIEIWINPRRFRNFSGDWWSKQDMSIGLVASVTAGLLAGPEMGFAVGFFAWITAAALYFWNVKGNQSESFILLNPSVSACIGGLLGGWILKFRPAPRQQRFAGFLIGALSQTLFNSIGLIHDTSSNVPADRIVTEVVIPWTAAIVSGGLGVLFFLWIIGDLKAQRSLIGAAQFQRALLVANQTLPFLRQGLNAESAQPIAEIVYSVVEEGAIALTDGRMILSHVGAGSDHHRAGDPLPQFLREEGLNRPETILDAGRIGCDHAGCPLTSGVFSPLLHDGEAFGGVLIYGAPGESPNPVMMRLGVGLAQFFSNYQVERAELERQTEAASQAELKALQSQVHPHFLFNVLNTLAAYCEIDPKRAGKLTVKLGTFLRRSLREAPAPLIPLREEMANVESYLEIERARFQDRLTVIQEIPEVTLDALVPSFGLQILVENAILHGMSKKAGAGRVFLKAETKAGRLWCVVQDEGPGFDPERREAVFSGEGRASGLLTLRERGRRLLGKRFLLRILSEKDKGATVIMAIPLLTERPDSETDSSDAVLTSV